MGNKVVFTRVTIIIKRRRFDFRIVRRNGVVQKLSTLRQFSLSESFLVVSTLFEI